MKRRVLAALLVLCMVLTLLATGVGAQSAENTQTPIATHGDDLPDTDHTPLSNDAPPVVQTQPVEDAQESKTQESVLETHAETHVCEHCDQETTWAALNAGSLPAEGHVYLESDVTLSSEWIVSGDLVLCLNGKTLTAAANKRIMTVSKGATVTITDCTAKTENGVYKAGKLTGGNVTGQGGAIYLEATTNTGAIATLHMYAGSITGNTASSNGGAIAVGYRAKCYIHGGDISNNKGTGGGAIWAASQTAVEVRNATICNNTMGGTGGSAIFMASSESGLLIEDTAITGNACTLETGWQGAIYMTNAGSTLTLQGKVIIAGNTTGGVAQHNIMLQNATGKVTLNGLTAGSSISIFNRGNTVAPSTILNGTQESLDGVVVVYENTLASVALADGAYTATTHSHKVDDTHSQITYQPWLSTTTLPTEGDYYLTGNVELTDVTTLSGDLNLCLNGFDVRAASGKQILVTVAEAPATVTISDCTATGEGDAYQAGRLYGGSAATGGAAIIRKNSTLKLYDGVITENTATAAGGAVYISAGGAFEMHGGAIIGNKAMNGDTLAPGGAIGAIDSKFTMTGGIISDNQGSNGGAINAYGGAVIEISGGQLCNNTASGNGGAIHTSNGAITVTISGNANLSGNTAVYGGAIYGYNNAGVKINVNGGTFEENTATTDGGAIYGAANSETTVSGGTFRKNTAGKNGGAIHGAANSKISVANATFTENEATGTNGGAICVMSGNPITVKDTTFTGNKAGTSGGAICATSRNAVITDSSMTKNQANSYSAILVYNGDLTLDSAAITQNQGLGNNYGAVCVNKTDGIVTVKGATKITGNTVGGGNTAQNLYLRNNNTFVSAKDLADGALIGVTLEQARLDANVKTITTGLSGTDYTAHFVSDNALYKIVLNGELSLSYSHEHGICGKPDCTDHKTTNYLSWDSSDSLPTHGNYCLSCDVVVNKETVADGNLNLCLNGHTITSTSDARILSTKAGATATVNITDCTAQKDAQGVYQAGGITGNTSKDGGSAIFVRTGSTVNFYEGKITGNTSAAGGGAIMIGGTFNMYGGEISDNKAVTADGKWRSGGAVYMNSGAIFTMAGGRISGNEAGDGGAVQAAGNNTVTITGGTIDRNIAHGNGGAINAMTGGTIHVENATLTGNSAESTGGAICATACETTVKGTAITKNQAKNYSAVIVFNKSLMLEDAKIEDNHSTNNTYGAVSVYLSGDATGSLTVKGATTIIGNTVGDDNTPQNLFLRNCNIYVTAQDLTAGAVIGVTLEQARLESGNLTVTTTLADRSFGQYFRSDLDSYSFAVTDVVALESGHRHKICGDAGCSEHGTTVFLPWSDATSLPTGGNYYLTRNLAVTKETIVSRDLNLCLNGHTVTSKDGIRILSTQNGAKVHISIGDCAAYVDSTNSYRSGGFLDNNNTSEAGGGVIFIRSGSTLDLFNGKINGNTSAAGGGGVLLSGTMNMYGGEINRNAARTPDGTLRSGGAVFMNSGSVLNLYGGSITANEALYGGAIYIGGGKLTVAGTNIRMNKATSGGAIYAKDSTVTVTDGKIYNNTTTSDGAAIYLIDGTKMVMNGGLITQNSTEATGGGVFLRGEGTSLVLKDGQITSNSAKAGAGVLTQTKSSFTMEGGMISANKAGAAGGGGAYISTGTTFRMTGGTIRYNTSPANGAGIYFLRSTGYLEGGTIFNNVADKDGAGACVNGSEVTVSGTTLNKNIATNGGAFSIMSASVTEKDGSKTNYPAKLTIEDGAQITENTAKSTGGAVFATGEGSQVLLTGGTISGNKAKHAGAILTQNRSSLTMSGGTVSKNSATSNGGGLYISTKTVFTMTGGTLSGNTAKAAGGGMYLLRSNVTMTGGTISGNTAKSAGGGMYLQRANATLSGGSVSSNSANDGGGVRAAGGKLALRGVTISYNKATKTGGGVTAGRQIVKENGVEWNELPTVTMTGGSIVGNESQNAGGILIQSKDSVFYLMGGRISGNKASSGGGGVYISTNSILNMSGGTISGNEARNGGGVFHLNSFGNYTGGVIDGNTAINCSGGVYTRSNTVLNMEGLTISNNVGDTNAGLLCQGESVLNMKNCVVKGNTCEKIGGGLYFTAKSQGTIENTEIIDNRAGDHAGGVMVSPLNHVTLTGCTISGNHSDAIGGGMYTRGLVTVNNCNFLNNTAAETGGGIGTWKFGYDFVHQDCGLYVNGSVFKGNSAGTLGGGIHLFVGTVAAVRDTVFEENTSQAEGGALWSSGTLELTSVTATGNKSGGKGFAVYLEDSQYDGRSYSNGTKKASGSMNIINNTNGDLYLGEKVSLAITGSGLAEGSKTCVTLASGLLTQRVFGIYDYEGGNLVYTISAGNRSIIEPEVADEQNTPNVDDPTDSSDNNGIITGVIIAAVALVAVAAVVSVIVIRNKKRPVKTKQGGIKQ